MSKLFVGGMRDGEWLDVPEDRSHWVVAERPKVLLSWPPPAFVTPTEIRQETYARMSFRGLDQVHRVYAGYGLTPDDVLGRLVTFYRPRKSEPEQNERLREVSMATVDAKLLGVGFIAILPDGGFQHVAPERITLKTP